MTTEVAGDKAGVPLQETQSLSPQEELTALRQEHEQTKVELKKAQDEAQAHHKNVTKKAEELRKAQQIEATIQGLKETIELQGTMVAEILDRGELGEIEPSRAKGKSYREQLAEMQRRSADPIKLATQREFERKAGEAEELAESAGLDIASDPKLAKVRRLFRKEDTADEGLVALKEIIGSIKVPESVGKKETDEERIDRVVEERLRVKMIEAKLITQEGIAPSGSGGLSDTDFVARIGSGELPLTKENMIRAKKLGLTK